MCLLHIDDRVAQAFHSNNLMHHTLTADLNHHKMNPTLIGSSGVIVIAHLHST